MNLRLYGSLITVLALGCQKAPLSDTTGFIIDGLEVVFKRTPGRPLVAAGFYLRGGLSYGNPEQAGLEPLLLATMMGGNLRRDEEQARGAALRATAGGGAGVVHRQPPGDDRAGYRSHDVAGREPPRDRRRSAIGPCLAYSQDDFGPVHWRFR